LDAAVVFFGGAFDLPAIVFFGSVFDFVGVDFVVAFAFAAGVVFGAAFAIAVAFGLGAGFTLAVARPFFSLGAVILACFWVLAFARAVVGFPADVVATFFTIDRAAGLLAVMVVFFAVVAVAVFFCTYQSLPKGETMTLAAYLLSVSCGFSPGLGSELNTTGRTL
jgi:hypothetical protein